MKKILTIAALLAASFVLNAQQSDFVRIPFAYKWISPTEVAFSYDGTYAGKQDFSVDVRKGYKLMEGTQAPEKYTGFPIKPKGAVNLTFSPDSTKLAFTRDNDLYVVDIASGAETRLTNDGSDLILNGYASWVYYEEILGRPSRYKAFWWSPDSQKIGFYRFDNSNVPMFPIYSPFGQDGSLSRTRYPKAGEPNPEVRIGITDLNGNIAWADFDPSDDQSFGIPFWGKDSQEFFIAREPRLQNQLDIYSLDACTAAKKLIYHEEAPTWLDWIEEVIFTDNGLYMARDFESGWQQIYFLSYDGKTFKRLTDGTNWRVNLVRVDEKKGEVYYTANRDSDVRNALYKLDSKGNITALTDPAMNVSGVKFSADGKHFVARLENYNTPVQIWIFDTKGRSSYKVADMKGEGYDPANYCLPQPIRLTLADGLVVPGEITYPVDFDPGKKYPVHVKIYGGPNTALVADRWKYPVPGGNWYSRSGIIDVTVDSRAAGHNGRAGLDLIFKDLTSVPVADFVAWADYFKSLPYVDGDRIGVEGFSFGGTMTTMLLCRHSDSYHYGIAGGGVYDWKLYDTQYTERFMQTPQVNPEGYDKAGALKYVKEYPVNFDDASGSVMLKITHGTGDDNVHFQNTLQLIDAMQKEGKKFQLMIYPDGMHGYRGYQGMHSMRTDMDFWTATLLRK